MPLRRCSPDDCCGKFAVVACFLALFTFAVGWFVWGIYELSTNGYHGYMDPHMPVSSTAVVGVVLVGGFFLVFVFIVLKAKCRCCECWHSDWLCWPTYAPQLDEPTNLDVEAGMTQEHASSGPPLASSVNVTESQFPPPPQQQQQQQ